MSESKVVIPKPNKGGRPATGRDPVRAIRLSDEFLAQVDYWATKQDDDPGRSEAIRRLVELGLKGAPRPAARRWTPDEERQFDELLNAGKEAAEIAVTLNRSRQAVYGRLQRLYRKRGRLPVFSNSGVKMKVKVK
jgi:hypothetical protein